MGNLTLQENIKKNQEYFENLQRCYNPSQVVCRAREVQDRGRSRSSEGFRHSTDFCQDQKITEFLGEFLMSLSVGISVFKTLRLVFLLDSNLVKSTDNIMSNIKSSRTKKQNFNRTQSSFSVFSGSLDETSSLPIVRIVERTEGIDIDIDNILKVKEVDRPFPQKMIEKSGGFEIEEKLYQEKKNLLKSREESLEEIRGVLKENLSKTSSARKIQFTLQSQDQLCVPEVKRRLRSPPPLHRELLTPCNEGNCTADCRREGSLCLLTGKLGR